VPKIVLVLGDIVTQTVDAVVNAANTELMPGGGVDGAITRAAGEAALEERVAVAASRGTPPLPTGEAVATSGGELPARWIIHTAGPIYRGTGDEAKLLASCHRSCLALADELGVSTLAFPAISTGIYGYPVQEAARIAVRTVSETPTSVNEVRFVLFDGDALAAFRDALGVPLDDA
jgi:O-acetyl-ADP-ribose deacetylase